MIAFFKHWIVRPWIQTLTFTTLLIVIAIVFAIPLVIFFPEIYRRSEVESSFEIKLWNTAFNTLVTFLAIWITIKKVDKEVFGQFYIDLKWPLLFRGFGFGVVVVVVAVAVSFGVGWVHFEYAGLTRYFFYSLIFYFLVAICEELIFRSYLLSRFSKTYNPIAANLVTALLFSFVHLGNDHVTLIGLISICLSGFWFGQVTHHTGSIWPAVGMHWSWNFIQGPVFGYGVSGHHLPGLFIPTLQGSDSLTGGAFGIEGSIVTVFMAFVAIIITHMKMRSLNPTSALNKP